MVLLLYKMLNFALILLLTQITRLLAHDIPVKVFNVSEEGFNSGVSIGNVFVGDGSDKSAEYYVVAIEPDSLDSLYTYISIDMTTGQVYLKQYQNIPSLKFSVLSISDGSAVTVLINFVETTTTTTLTSTTTSTTTTSTSISTTELTTTVSEIAKKPMMLNTCLNLNKYKLEQVNPSRLDARLIEEDDASYIDSYKCYLIDSNSNTTLNLNKYSRLGSMMEPIVAVDPEFFVINRVVGLIVIDCSFKEMNHDQEKEKLVYLNSQEEVEDYYYSYFMTSKSDKNAHVRIDSLIPSTQSNSFLAEQLLVKFECNDKRYAYSLRVKNNNYSYSNSNQIRNQLLILNQTDRKSSLVLCVVVKSLPSWPTTTEPDKAYFVSKSSQTQSTTVQETSTTSTTMTSTVQVMHSSLSLSDWLANQNNLVIVVITSSVALFIITAFICLLYLTMHLYTKWKESKTTTSYNSRRVVGRKKPLNSALSTHTIETRASTNSSTSKCSTIDPKLKISHLNSDLHHGHSISGTNNNNNNNPFCFSNSYLNELGGSCNLLDSLILNSNLNLMDKNETETTIGAGDTSFGLANYRFDDSALIGVPSPSTANNINYINSESSDLYKWSNLLDWKLEFNSLSNVLDDLARLK